MTKIMLVDDEQGIQILVKFILTVEGYEFRCASNGKDALTMLERERPDLLILDIMMPDMNGYDVCAEVRKHDSRLPIIFLSAKGDIVDKSMGFGLGADDFLVKPFIPQELLLRINAVLRRNTVPEGSVLPPQDGIIRHKDLSINLARHKVTVAGRTIDLTPKEFHILSLLASSPGRVFTRDDIIQDVWGPDYVGESTDIAVFIRRIRKKIEEDPSNPRYLQTVWHVGYRFGD